MSTSYSFQRSYWGFLFAVAVAVVGCSGGSDTPAERPPKEHHLAKPATDAKHGVRIRYSLQSDGMTAAQRDAAISRAVVVVGSRVREPGLAEPKVWRDKDYIAVDLWGYDKRTIEQIKRVIRRNAALEFKLVQEVSRGHGRANRTTNPAGALMRRIKNYVGYDRHARALGIAAHKDEWFGVNEERFEDYYLRAKAGTKLFPIAEAKRAGCWVPGRRHLGDHIPCKQTGEKILKDYLARLVDTKPEYRLSTGFEIRYEHVRSSREGSYWRTFHLRREPLLTGADVIDVRIGKPWNGQPTLIVMFGKAAKQRLEALTRKHLGRRLAIMLDGRVASTPVIGAPFTAGTISITLGRRDDMKREAIDLVHVLRAGLPAPLVEESSEVISR